MLRNYLPVLQNHEIVQKLYIYLINNMCLYCFIGSVIYIVDILLNIVFMKLFMQKLSFQLRNYNYIFILMFILKF